MRAGSGPSVIAGAPRAGAAAKQPGETGAGAERDPADIHDEKGEHGELDRVHPADREHAPHLLREDRGRRGGADENEETRADRRRVGREPGSGAAVEMPERLRRHRERGLRRERRGLGLGRCGARQLQATHRKIQTSDAAASPLTRLARRSTTLALP